MEESNFEKTSEKIEKNRKKISLTEAAKSGNKEKTLIALRDKLAITIENCESGRDMAANSKRLMEVMAEIDEIKAEKKAKAAKKKAARQPSKRDQLRSLNAR